MATTRLEYYTPARSARRYRCLRAVVPYTAGVWFGALLAGAVVCFGLSSYIVSVADTPNGPEQAVFIWMFLVTLALPVAACLCLIQLAMLVYARSSQLKPRRGWVNFLIGVGHPCVAVVIALRISISNPPWVDSGRMMVAALLLGVAVPWLLVRPAPVPGSVLVCGSGHRENAS